MLTEIIYKGKLKPIIQNRECKVKLIDVSIISKIDANDTKSIERYIDSLKWMNGVIELTPPTFEAQYGVARFKSNDHFYYSLNLIADIAYVNGNVRAVEEEIDYTKKIVWIYKDRNLNDVAIYDDSTVKMKLENGGTIVGKPQFDEELKKYYIQGFDMKYFFFVGVEVEKES